MADKQVVQEPSGGAPGAQPSPGAGGGDQTVEAPAAVAEAQAQAGQAEATPTTETAAQSDAGQEALEAVTSIENQLGEVLSNLGTLTAGAAPRASANIDLLRDVQLSVKIELGRTRMYIEDILRLGEGSVVELDKLAGDPVDVFVNDRLVARGEVLVLNDNFCVRIGEIVAQD